MNLIRYKVENFRSVLDSGWVECNNVTTLVGINEAGKSNLLLALWKLNPAREGSIDALHDIPVSKLSSYRKIPEEVKFITAEFELDESSIKRIQSTVSCNLKNDKTVRVSRYYNGRYTFEFPSGSPESTKTKLADETDEEGKQETVKEGPIVPYERGDLENAVLNEIPKFVYYSNYGNLSAKIYLPNVIKWLSGQTVEGIDANPDQIRTLRVLFEFVGLQPHEILELGKDPKEMAWARTGYRGDAQPTIGEINQAEKDKEERSILLQSASGSLTKRFKDWWKQGEYKFRFEADGDYFRVWVSDRVRTDEVALELRSTGLQWFISFYLIFLVESQEQHKNAVLLLDEAGLTLHPLAQKDLAVFFDSLSETNQIVNTTHSPFIVDTTNIDRCRVVYMNNEGFTIASSNLREGSDSLNEKSIYAVHAALGLSVSDVLLQGCQSVVVEGPSDQFYLNAIKAFLIREKQIAPQQEIVFVPSGGVKGVPGVVSMISGKDEELPYVIVDSDKIGTEAKKRLASGLYHGLDNKLLDVHEFSKIEGSEVEDLIPIELLRKGIDKLFNNVEEKDFIDEYDPSKPIINQIEAFANKNNVSLEKGWKVPLAVSAKTQLKNKKLENVTVEYLEKWKSLFNSILSK